MKMKKYEVMTAEGNLLKFEMDEDDPRTQEFVELMKTYKAENDQEIKKKIGELYGINV